MTDAEYQELLELAYQQGTLAQSEKEIILQIISPRQTDGQRCDAAARQMAAISDDLSIEEMIAAARNVSNVAVCRCTTKRRTPLSAF